MKDDPQKNIHWETEKTEDSVIDLLRKKNKLKKQESRK